MFLFVSQFTITWLIPKIDTHDAFIDSYVKLKFQLFRFLSFASYEQINPHLPKFANKNKSTSRSCGVPITEQMAHYTFMWELTSSNFYQSNCIDFKPVPIIRFIFQFVFRIVKDSDLSGFGILKCPP